MAGQSLIVTRGGLEGEAMGDTPTSWEEFGQGKARASWDAGNLCFVLTLTYLGGRINEEQAAQAVGDVLGVGWNLNSTAITYAERHAGAGRPERVEILTCMFTFTRYQGTG